MRSSAFSCFLDPNDEIGIVPEKTFLGANANWVTLGQVNIHGITNRQLLDLAMKIQSVINQIDQENREADESRLMNRDYEGDRP